MTGNTTIQISEDMKAKASLYAKMARVMAGLNSLPKDGTNPHFGYKFVEATAVADAVRKGMSEHGIAFFANMTGYGEKDGVLTVSFEFTFADTTTGATTTHQWFGEAASRLKSGARDDKAINKAATAAEKYFLLKTFVISTGDEPDADRDAPQEASKAGKNRREHEPGYATRKVIPTTLNNTHSIDEPPNVRVFTAQQVKVAVYGKKKTIEYIGQGYSAIDFSRTYLRAAGFKDDELPDEATGEYTLKYPVEVTAKETRYEDKPGTYWKVMGLQIKLPDIAPETEAKPEDKRKAS